MPQSYRTEIYDEDRHRWVMIADTPIAGQARRQYDMSACQKKRILEFKADKRGHIRPTVVLDSSVEQVVPAPIPELMIDTEARVMREDDGNVLRAKLRGR